MKKITIAEAIIKWKAFDKNVEGLIEKIKNRINEHTVRIKTFNGIPQSSHLEECKELLKTLTEVDDKIKKCDKTIHNKSINMSPNEKNIYSNKIEDCKNEILICQNKITLYLIELNNLIAAKYLFYKESSKSKHQYFYLKEAHQHAVTATTLYKALQITSEDDYEESTTVMLEEVEFYLRMYVEKKSSCPIETRLVAAMNADSKEKAYSFYQVAADFAADQLNIKDITEEEKKRNLELQLIIYHEQGIASANLILQGKSSRQSIKPAEAKKLIRIFKKSLESYCHALDIKNNYLKFYSKLSSRASFIIDEMNLELFSFVASLYALSIMPRIRSSHLLDEELLTVASDFAQTGEFLLQGTGKKLMATQQTLKIGVNVSLNGHKMNSFRKLLSEKMEIDLEETKTEKSMFDYDNLQFSELNKMVEFVDLEKGNSNKPYNLCDPEETKKLETCIQLAEQYLVKLVAFIVQVENYIKLSASARSNIIIPCLIIEISLIASERYSLLSYNISDKKMCAAKSFDHIQVAVDYFVKYPDVYIKKTEKNEITQELDNRYVNAEDDYYFYWPEKKLPKKIQELLLKAQKTTDRDLAYQMYLNAHQMAVEVEDFFAQFIVCWLQGRDYSQRSSDIEQYSQRQLFFFRNIATAYIIAADIALMHPVSLTESEAKLINVYTKSICYSLVSMTDILLQWYVQPIMANNTNFKR